MPSTTPFNPRQRLSLLTNSTLGHDVSQAFKASTNSSTGLTTRSIHNVVNETPAPPPSPVDFSFPNTPAGSRKGSTSA